MSTTTKTIYHLNPDTGNVSLCRSTGVRGCPFGGSEYHFATKEEAHQYYEDHHVPFPPESAFTKNERRMLREQPENITYTTPEEKYLYNILKNSYNNRREGVAAMERCRHAHESLLQQLEEEPDKIENKQYSIDSLVEKDFHRVTKYGTLTPEELSELKTFARPKMFETYKKREAGLVNFWRGVTDRQEKALREDYSYTNADGEEKRFDPFQKEWAIEEDEVSFSYYRGKNLLDDEHRKVQAMLAWYHDHSDQNLNHVYERETDLTNRNRLYSREAQLKNDLNWYDSHKSFMGNEVKPRPLGGKEGTTSSLSIEESTSLREVEGIENFSLENAETLYEKYRQEAREEKEDL